jgi:hypothetical protein
MPSCRLLPHGGYTLIPAVLSTVAWIAALSQDGCDYAYLTGYIVAEATKSTAVEYLQVGRNAYRVPILVNGQWNIDYSSSCIAYDDQVFTIDAYWQASKGFAFVSLVLGGGGALFLWFSSCFVFSRGTWKWAGYEVLFASIFQCLAFMWFNTYICREGDNQCSLSYGSKADIASATCWLVSALCIFCRYPALKLLLSQEQEHNNAGDEEEDRQYGGEGTAESEHGDVSSLPTENVLPVDGDANLTIQLEEKKGNETVVQTRPADADLL